MAVTYGNHVAGQRQLVNKRFDPFTLTAILTAISRKSYWHLSKTLATQTGMTNQWLASQGLLSVRALWIKAHGYA